MQFTVAAIQMTSSDDWQANLTIAEQEIQMAAQAGAQLVVLPENALLFAGKLLRKLAESGEQAVILQRLATLAQKHKLWLVVGSHPSLYRLDKTQVSANRVRQSCLVFSPMGELAARYDKIHLFDAVVGDTKGQYKESNFIEPGEKELIVINMDGMKVGLSICYDVRFPELYRALADKGADLVIVPAAFTHRTGEAHWHTLLRCRAIENQVFVLGVGQCGWHTPTRRTYGNTVCYSPWGGQIKCLEEEPATLYVQLDLREIQTCRDAMPVHSHRRL